MAQQLLSDADIGLTADAPKLLSDADIGLAPQGGLSNAPDDGILSGAAKGTATGIIKGLANSIGTVGNLHDMAGYVHDRLHSAISGRPMEDVTADRVRAEDMIRNPQPDDNAFMRGIKTIGSAIGTQNLPSGSDISAPILAKTGEYKPESGLGRALQAGVETAAGMVGPGAGAAAPGATVRQALIQAPTRMAPANFTAGAVGDRVTDLTGDPLLGMVAGNAVPAVAGAAAAGATKLVKPSLGANARDEMVADRLRAAASDPQKLEADLRFQPGETIPGAKPTTGQLTADTGILSAERAARADENFAPAFNERDADQNSSRLQALRSAAPDADPMKVSQTFQQHLDHLDNTTQAAVDSLHQKAQQLADQMGPQVDPAVLGAQLRESMGDQLAKVSGNIKSLYDLVPDNVNAVASPLRERGMQVDSSINPRGTPASGDVSRILETVKGLPEVVPFADLRAIDRDLTTSMVKAKLSGDMENHGRLVQLKGGVKDAINNALDHQHAWEQDQVSQGAMKVGDTVAARMEQWVNDTYSGRPRNNNEARSAMATGVETPGDSGLSGAARDSGEGSGRAPTYQGVSAEQARKPPPSLNDWIASNQGLRDESGELTARGLPKWSQARRNSTPQGIINNESGMPLDVARQRAAEAGYLGGNIDDAMANTTTNHLLDALDNGHQTYSVYDQDHLHAHQVYKARQDARSADKTIPRELEAGLAEQQIPRPDSRPSPTTSPEFDIFPGDLPPGRTLHDAEPARVIPNMTADAAGSLAAANAAHADMARTYREGPVAPTLKTNGFADNYRVPDSGVMKRAWKSGDEGYTTVKAFLKAADNAPEAVAALKHYALNDLRAGVKPDGTLDPRKFDAWRASHAQALKGLDETSPGFSGRFANAAKATNELAAAGLKRKQAIKEFQQSEAAKFLGKTDPGEVAKQVGTIIADGKNGPTRMKELVAAAKGNKDVLEGLQAAAVDWITQKTLNATHAGTSGERTLSPTALGKLLDEHGVALKEVLTPDIMRNVRDVADDLARANLTVTATKEKTNASGSGQSAIHALRAHAKNAAGHVSLLPAMMTGAIAGGMHGGIEGALLGGAGGGAGFFLNKLRSAGVDKVDAMFKDALLNPERAKYYLAKVPVRSRAPAWQALTRSLQRELIMFEPMREEEKRQGYARGGLVQGIAPPAPSASPDFMQHMNQAVRARMMGDVATHPMSGLAMARPANSTGPLGLPGIR